MFRKALITAAAAVALAGGAAAPALAAPACTGAGCVDATATVNQSISLTGLSSSITFPAADPGGTATATAAEAYTVTTNDPAGMTLTITPGAVGMLNASASNDIPNAALTVTENATHAGPLTFPDGTTPLTVDTQGAAGAWNYAEDWAVKIPATTPAGSYTETFTYLAVGN